MASLSKALDLPADIAARRLLGCQLVRRIGAVYISCKIVETEAYDQTDPASHSYHGKTARNEVMLGSAGFAYVYFTYGMHHCLNIVVGPINHASAVLIRSIEPLSGLDIIKANRQNITNEVMMTNGPAKICQALSIGRELNKHNLAKNPLKLILTAPLSDKDVVVSTRIGISKAKSKPWRFYIKNNPYVSRLSN
ncbi:MAG: DNA-3-methyladenine glycosylase [Candidatus Saccharimonadales bacterium]